MGNRNVKAAVEKVGEKLPYNYHLTIDEADEVLRIASKWAGAEEGRVDILSAINTAFKFGVSVGSRAHKAGRIPAI